MTFEINCFIFKWHWHQRFLFFLSSFFFSSSSPAWSSIYPSIHPSILPSILPSIHVIRSSYYCSTCSISHNSPFRTEMCTFLFWMVHCGIWNRCIVGFVNQVNVHFVSVLLVRSGWWPVRIPTRSIHMSTLWVAQQDAINTLRPKQNGRHFADDILKCIFLYGNVWIPNKISLKFVPKGPINNNQALVQVMAWRRPGDKPLSEPMLRQNGHHFPDDIFKCIFFNENILIAIRISLKFVLKSPIDKKKQHWFRQQAIIWTNDGLVCWCKYASLGLNELNPCGAEFTAGNIKICMNFHCFSTLWWHR